MAKYDVDYVCGHGSTQVNLFGKSDERERRLEWYRNNYVCKDCFKKQKIAEDEARQPTIHLNCPVAHARGKVQIEVAATGKVDSNLTALNTLGYHWHNKSVGIMSFLGDGKEKWLSKKQFVSDAKEAEAFIADCSEELEALGYQWESNKVMQISGVTQLIAHTLEGIAAKKKLMAKYLKYDPYPTKPEVAFEKVNEIVGESYWNGSFYGKNLLEIYVSDKRIVLPSEVSAPIKKYLSDIKDWNARNKHIDHLLGDKFYDYSIDELTREIENATEFVKKRNKALKSDPKPSDKCFDFMRERHGDDFESWNKSIYGFKSPFTYYINDERFTMTKKQKEAILSYWERLKSWKEFHDMG